MIQSSRVAPGPSPESAVRAELARALGAFAIAPLRAAFYLARRRSLARAVRRDLEDAAVPDPPPAYRVPERPLRIFLSCAEASGEAHAARLARELRRSIAAHGGPEPELIGLGGDELGAEGVRLVGDPVKRAVMGLEAAGSVSFFRELLRSAASVLRNESIDVCVAVDSPAFHVPLGHIAHRYGVPMVHFATPQYWAWAPWRVRGYRRAVDLALTILPFEPAWFRRHGVSSAHVGHPQQDQLATVEPRSNAQERTTLVLLPGSRDQVIRSNLPWMLDVVELVRAELSELEVVIPHDKSASVATIESELRARGPTTVRLASGGLHAELARASVALSVSGTVLLDLLHHRVPTVAIYRLENRLLAGLKSTILLTPWFSSVNLLAGREIMPEFSFTGEGPRTEVTEHLVRWLSDPAANAAARSALDAAAERLGTTGATQRAAEHVLGIACGNAPVPSKRASERESSA